MFTVLNYKQISSALALGFFMCFLFGCKKETTGENQSRYSYLTLNFESSFSNALEVEDGYILAGRKLDPGKIDHDSFQVGKIDPFGKLIWLKTINDPNSSYNKSTKPLLLDLKNGTYLISNSRGRQFTIISENGDIIVDETYPAFIKITRTPYFNGKSLYSIVRTGNLGLDNNIRLYKLNTSGTLESFTNYPRDSFKAEHITQPKVYKEEQGKVFIYGLIKQYNNPHKQFFTATLLHGGSVENINIDNDNISTSGIDFLQNISSFTNDNKETFICSRNNPSTLHTNNIKTLAQNFVLRKLASDGSILWSKETNLKKLQILSMASTIDGGGILVGKDEGRESPKIVKFSNDGDIKFIRALPFSGAISYGIGRSNGDIFTLGYFTNIGMGVNNLTAKTFIANLNSEGSIP